jgi:hypothetical protein
MTRDINNGEPVNRIPEIGISETLNSPEFMVRTAIAVTKAGARELIAEKYPDFNFGRGIKVSDFAAKVRFLAELSQQVVIMNRAEKPFDAYVLARKIKLVGDPITSRSGTTIEDIIKATHGNLRMACAFLNINRRTGPDWLDFIVRTWGMKPNDFK